MATLGDTTVVSLNVLNTITGNGSGITNLNASNIATGSLAVARITAGSNGQVLGTSNGATAWVSPTLNTAGSTNATTKLFLIGAGSQAANPQTYSSDKLYTSDSGTLYATKTTALSPTQNLHPALITGGIDTSTHLELDYRQIIAKTNGTTEADLYLGGGTTDKLVYLSTKPGESDNNKKAYAKNGVLYSKNTEVSINGHTHSQYLTAHPTITTETDTTSTAAPEAGDTFTAIDSITRETNGHVTKINTKTITLPEDTKNTAGASNSANDKLYLVGAGTQTDGIKTYSNSNVYTQSGAIYAKGGNINTDINNTPFYISRTGGTSEAVAHFVDDAFFHIDYTNDEAAASIKWQIINTDQERATDKGADASTHNMILSATKDTATLTIDGVAVSMNGHTHNYAGSSSAGGKANSAAVADKLANTAKIGDTNQPVYFTASGVPAAISYTIGKSVPSDAVFSDTTNTAGASNSTSKLYLVGAGTQTDGIQTYTNSNVWEQSGVVYASGMQADAFKLKRDTLKATMQYNATEDCVEFIFA